MSSNKNLNTIHQDVLYCPIPEEKNDKEILFGEVIRRANGAFKLKSYTDAELLYSRAIAINPTDNIYSNRCITRIKLNKLIDAEGDANMVIEKNPTWCKGYIRKAQIYELLKEYKDAEKHYKTAINMSIDTNLETIIRNKLKKLESLISNKQNPQISNRLQANRLYENKRYFNNDIKKNIVCDDGSEEEVDINMRGYRLKDDGSRTTFFNNDISDNVKELIGDITPQKIATT